MSSLVRVSSLLAWCAENDIWIDPRLDIVDGGGSIAVFVRSGWQGVIEPGTTVVKIPCGTVLSAQTCALAGTYAVEAPAGAHGVHLALALALYDEILQGPGSRWVGYLASLPPALVFTALFWGLGPDELATAAGRSAPTAEDVHRAEDGQRARGWLRGTEVERREVRTEDGGWLLDAVDAYYHRTAEPMLGARHGERATLYGFYRAFSLIMSRAFLVDAFHGLALVPVADSFNHASENDVHLESDYDVCPRCGALFECGHDGDGEGDGEGPGIGGHGDGGDIQGGREADKRRVRGQDGAQSRTDEAPALRGALVPAHPISHPTPAFTSSYAREAESEASFDMVTNTFIPSPSTSGGARREVFNTYGSPLSNAALIAHYGFALPEDAAVGVGWEGDALARLGLAVVLGASGGDDEDAAGGPEGGECGHTARTVAREVLQNSQSWGARPSELLAFPPAAAHAADGGGEGRLEGAVGGVESRAGPHGLDVLSSASYPGGAADGFWIDEDARLSLALFAWCALSARRGSGAGEGTDACVPEVWCARVGRLVRAVLALEQSWVANRVGVDAEDGLQEDGVLEGEECVSLFESDRANHDEEGEGMDMHVWLVRTCCTVITLCRARAAEYANAGSEDGAEALGRVLDSVPEEDACTRLALGQAIGELSLLESCAARWAEVGSACEGDGGLGGGDAGGVADGDGDRVLR